MYKLQRWELVYYLLEYYARERNAELYITRVLRLRDICPELFTHYYVPNAVVWCMVLHEFCDQHTLDIINETWPENIIIASVEGLHLMIKNFHEIWDHSLLDRWRNKVPHLIDYTIAHFGCGSHTSFINIDKKINVNNDNDIYQLVTAKYDVYIDAALAVSYKSAFSIGLGYFRIDFDYSRNLWIIAIEENEYFTTSDYKIASNKFKRLLYNMYVTGLTIIRDLKTDIINDVDCNQLVEKYMNTGFPLSW